MPPKTKSKGKKTKWTLDTVALPPSDASFQGKGRVSTPSGEPRLMPVRGERHIGL